MATETTKEEWVANGRHIIDRDFAGEEFVITEGGKPRVKLVQLSEEEWIEIERKASESAIQQPGQSSPSPRA